MLYNSHGIAFHFISRRFAVVQQRDKLRSPREKGQTGEEGKDSDSDSDSERDRKVASGRTEAAQ